MIVRSKLRLVWIGAVLVGVCCLVPNAMAGGTLNDCCQPSPDGTPGCDDPLCEGCVCVIDPFCCDSAWDQICADEACDLCNASCACCGGDELEACCFPNGNCGNLTVTRCAEAGGTPQGPGIPCDASLCPPPEPKDACCFSNGNCIIRPASLCLKLGGTPLPGLTCEPNACPQPDTGACCFPNGNCIIRPADICAGLGGVPQGPGSSCDPNLCPGPEPKDACCFPNGNCIIRRAGICLDLGGAPQGAGSSCDPNVCPLPEPKDACCFPNGACITRTREDCLDFGGEPRPGEACTPEGTCPPVGGACCFPSGGCEDVPSAADCPTGQFNPGIPCSSGICASPECEAATCETFVLCQGDPDCVCVSLAGGGAGGVCVIGATPCGELTLCPGGVGDCAPGEVCAVDTCCVDPVCVRQSDFCPDVGGCCLPDGSCVNVSSEAECAGQFNPGVPCTPGLCDAPECAANTCVNLVNCQDRPDCFCFQLAGGGGVCAESTSCAPLTLCPNGQGDCPAGEICTTGTCCSPPDVCIPVGIVCEDPVAAPDPEPGALTIQGVQPTPLAPKPGTLTTTGVQE